MQEQQTKQKFPDKGMYLRYVFRWRILILLENGIAISLIWIQIHLITLR
jgi:hypothetical protein